MKTTHIKGRSSEDYDRAAREIMEGNVDHIRFDVVVTVPVSSIARLVRQRAKDGDSNEYSREVSAEADLALSEDEGQIGGNESDSAHYGTLVVLDTIADDIVRQATKSATHFKRLTGLAPSIKKPAADNG